VSESIAKLIFLASNAFGLVGESFGFRIACLFNLTSSSEVSKLINNRGVSIFHVLDPQLDLLSAQYNPSSSLLQI